MLLLLVCRSHLEIVQSFGFGIQLQGFRFHDPSQTPQNLPQALTWPFIQTRLHQVAWTPGANRQTVAQTGPRALAM